VQNRNAYFLRKRKKTCTFIKIDQVQNRNASSKLFWIQLIWSYVNGMTILQIHWCVYIYIYPASLTQLGCIVFLSYFISLDFMAAHALSLPFRIFNNNVMGRWYLHCSNIITTLPLTIFPPKLITILAWNSPLSQPVFLFSRKSHSTVTQPRKIT